MRSNAEPSKAKISTQASLAFLKQSSHGSNSGGPKEAAASHGETVL